MALLAAWIGLQIDIVRSTNWHSLELGRLWDGKVQLLAGDGMRKGQPDRAGEKEENNRQFPTMRRSTTDLRKKGQNAD